MHQTLDKVVHDDVFFHYRYGMYAHDELYPEWNPIKQKHILIPGVKASDGTFIWKNEIAGAWTWKLNCFCAEWPPPPPRWAHYPGRRHLLTSRLGGLQHHLDKLRYIEVRSVVQGPHVSPTWPKVGVSSEAEELTSEAGCSIRVT